MGSMSHSSRLRGSVPSQRFWTHTPFPRMWQEGHKPCGDIFHVRANAPFHMHKPESEGSPHSDSIIR